MIISLVWFDCDFGSSTFCLIQLGLVRNWQNGRVRGQNCGTSLIKVKPTQPNYPNIWTKLHYFAPQGDDGLEAALWREADAQAQCYPTSDLMEGVNAVREKRSPDFKLYEDFKS